VDRAGRTPLHHAAFKNDVAAIETLIAHGSSPDVQDKQGLTPLHFAAQEYAVAAASALLDAGAAVELENSYGNTPLFVAVFNSNGRGELIKLLRAHGADPLRVNKHGQTAVGLARLIGNYPVADFFMDLPD
jgi:ankyrin repeat protein